MSLQVGELVQLTGDLDGQRKGAVVAAARRNAGENGVNRSGHHGSPKPHMKTPGRCRASEFLGAGHESRTRDFNLGNTARHVFGPLVASLNLLETGQKQRIFNQIDKVVPVGQIGSPSRKVTQKHGSAR